MWIDGEDVESGGGATFDRHSPAHGALVTRAPRGTAADADRAIAAARKAFDAGPWPKMTAAERSGVLLGTADLIDRDRDLLAHLDSLESGKPISQARTEIEDAADIWRYAAALARTLRGESYASLGSARTGSALSCASRSAWSRSSRRGIFPCGSFRKSCRLHWPSAAPAWSSRAR
jgi:betaine-aldehyde dehydrogenase